MYIVEAHPKDGWDIPMDKKIADRENINQPTQLEERLKIANEFAKDLKVTDHMVVDNMSNDADAAYETRPERLYVIEAGKIKWRCGLGPFQYDVKGLAKYLEETYPDKALQKETQGCPCVSRG